MRKLFIGTTIALAVIGCGGGGNAQPSIRGTYTGWYGVTVPVTVQASIDWAGNITTTNGLTGHVKDGKLTLDFLVDEPVRYDGRCITGEDIQLCRTQR